MSLQAVQTEILEPMQALFLPPRQMDADAQRAALRGYAVVLQGYEAGTLKAAWAEVVAGHTTRSWPVPGVIVLACRKNAKERAVELKQQRGRYPWEPQDITANRLRWEGEVRRSQMARDAVKAGCSWSLKCRVVNDGMRAEQIDLRDLISEHLSAERTAASLKKGERVWDRFRDRYVTFTDDNRDVALKMWRNVLVQEAETQEEIRRACVSPRELQPA